MSASAGRVVVVGGGVGGTVVANRVARSGAGLDVTVVDSHGTHLYQAGLLERALGGGSIDGLERPERSLLDPRARLSLGRAVALDPERRLVRLDTGEALPYDALALATGARPDTRSIPGFRDGVFHFHCRKRVPHLAAALEELRGGRVVVGAAGLPYKCPASVLSFALLLDEKLRREGRRAGTRITFVYPVEGVQPSPEASALGERLLARREIEVVSPFALASVDAAGRRLLAADGRAVAYDLAVLAPPHTGAPLAHGSGLAGGRGFIPVDPETLAARGLERTYVLGDAAEVCGPEGRAVPKSGSAARRQAEAVAARIVRELGRGPRAAAYDGGATCLAATGGGKAVRIDLRYGAPPRILGPGLVYQWMRLALDRLYFALIRRA